MRNLILSRNVNTVFLLSMFSVFFLLLLSPALVDLVVYIKYHIPKSEMSLCCTEYSNVIQYVGLTLYFLLLSLVFIFFILKKYRVSFQTKGYYGFQVGINIFITNILYIFSLMMSDITYDSGWPFWMLDPVGFLIYILSALIFLIFGFIYSIKLRSLKTWVFLICLFVFSLWSMWVYLAIFLIIDYIITFFLDHYKKLSENL